MDYNHWNGLYGYTTKITVHDAIERMKNRILEQFIIPENFKK